MARTKHGCVSSNRKCFPCKYEKKRDGGVPKDYVFVMLLLILPTSIDSLKEEECLTGKFTDVQMWALQDGSLSPDINNSHALDLSGQPDALSELRLLMSRNAEDLGLVRKLNTFEETMDLRPDPHEQHFNVTEEGNLGDIILKNIYFLSLARNTLDRIPLFYTDANGTSGSNWKHLKYLSLYGNQFYADTKFSQNLVYTVTLNATNWEEVNPKHYFSYAKGRSNWAADLERLDLIYLLELDLRNCSIQILYDETFVTLKSLRRLYLSDNQIHQIYSSAFNGLSKLTHLDISRNMINVFDNDTGLIEGLTLLTDTFSPLINLKSLDFSHTRIIQTCSTVFEELSPTVERLSLCYTRFPMLAKGVFAGTSLKHLDISGNVALEQINHEAFYGIEHSLEVLFARRLAIKNLKPFQNLVNLNVLNLAQNDINQINSEDFEKLKQLHIIDLSENRITNWNACLLTNLEHLELLKLNKNNLNLLSTNMMNDFNNLKFLALGANSFVCNCHVRSFMDRVLRNDRLFEITTRDYPEWFTNGTGGERIEFPDPSNREFYIALSEDINFHNAYIYYSNLIHRRNTNFTQFQNRDYPLEEYDEEIENAFNFSFRLLDYSEKNYECIDSDTNTFLQFSKVQECGIENFQEIEPPGISSSTLMVIFLITLALVILIATLIAWKWWYVRYFFLMMKNIAILSIMGKDNSIDDCDKVFTYDVFVSYCDDDRSWVLDELLPQVENNGSISVCLHERDFQVGLSILENIISCIDRSRALLMVVSSHFLKSQWCQFEMHLAQHRLLETRREQLILVLLEEIPRRKRPNTLHYLMMTKTYIVWPKSINDRPVFWKRLKRAITYGRAVTDQYSIA